MVTLSKNKFIFGILFLMIIFSIGSVIAQPPFQVQPTFIEGYFIEIPEQGMLKQNDDFTFFFHVFNLSTGVPLDDTSVECEFNLHNSSSILIYTNTSLPFDDTTTAFFVEVKGGNFSSIGDYNYVTHCSSLAFGGVVSVQLIVTPTGLGLDQPQSYIILGLILLLLFLSGIFLYIGKDMEYLPAKIFLMSLGLLFLMFVVGVSLNIINQLLLVGSVISGIFGSLYTLMTILISAWGIGLIVYLIYVSVRQFYSNRGMFDDND